MCAPVESPPAWRMRFRLCAASRPSATSPSVAVEGHAEVHEIVDPVGRGLDEDARGLLVHESRAGFDRVPQVDLGPSSAQRRRDAALCVLRVHSSMPPLVSTHTDPCSPASSAA